MKIDIKIHLVLGIALVLICPKNIAQVPEHLRHLYKPQTERVNNDEPVDARDTSQTESKQQYTSEPDSVNADSLQQVWQRRQDSIATRLKFIEDSIRVREVFVRDSIAERKRILDSLQVLKRKLEPLLEASIKNFSNQIIFRTGNITFIGDTLLSNYESDIITFDFSSPYTPWKSVVNLSDKPPSISYTKLGNRITGLSCPQFTCTYKYVSRSKTLIINSKSSIVNRTSGKVYKEPIDSVFFNREGRVAKIKQYVQYSKVAGSYKKGEQLYLQLTNVKQFEYDRAGNMTLYELTKFCDKRQAGVPDKVCNVTRFNIYIAGDTFRITRTNTPENEFSDGTFVYTYTNGNLSGVSFENVKKTEKRKTIIEVNEEGNVSRYLYDKGGKINQTLLVNYNKMPNGKEKVETITCVFEDDGISYYQKNNTTGRSRSRDKMTLEWTDWK